jgi:hypothetical protein
MTTRSLCGAAVLTAVCLAAALGRPAPAAPPPAKAAPPAAPADGPAYAIKFTRPVKVGDRYRYVVDSTLVQSFSGNLAGQNHRFEPTSFVRRFDATEQILAVNAQGEPIRASYTVNEYSERIGKRSGPAVLQPGRVLTVETGKFKSKLTLDEGSLTLLDELLLRRIVPMPSLKSVTLDDCFGSAAPRKVGESWPVSADAFAQWASQEGAKLTPKDVSGTVRLKAIKSVDGVPHLLVTGRVLMQRYAPDPREMPDVKFESATNEIKFTKLLPADPSGHCLTDTRSEKVVVHARSNDGDYEADLTVDVTFLNTVGIKRTPLPPAGVASGT